MVTNKEKFIYALAFLGLYFILIYIGDLSFIQDRFLLIIPFAIAAVALYLVFHKKSKDQKRAGDYIKQDLAAMNYTILEERPLTIREQYENFEFDFGPFINGISVERLRYKNKMMRHFVVRNENGYDFELIITIIQTWRDKIKFRIESTSRIRN
jgi:hypothetical protein